MKRKQNNNLILITNKDNEKLYYSSYNRAAMSLGLQANSVKWAVNHSKKITDFNGNEVKIELVDGSEIPYKLINN